MKFAARVGMTLTFVILSAGCAQSPEAELSDVRAPWARHVIDAGLRGADGTRWADVDGDGALDVVTAWEQSGKIRVCLNPGSEAVRGRWRCLDTGSVASPEDAVLVDLDRDGTLDVVTSREGQSRSIDIHWGPRDHARLFERAAWETATVPAAAGREMWMFVAPAQIDGLHGVDLFAGSKGDDASVSWLGAPMDPRNAGAWKLHRLRPAGWIMSLIARDLDGDGDPDAVVSDRKGSGRGVFWLEHPGPDGIAEGAAWTEHTIGAPGEEVMFIDLVDVDADGRVDILATAKPRKVLVFHQPRDPRRGWRAEAIELPGELGTAKAVRAADVDLDGGLDLVLSWEEATGDRAGVSWHRRQPNAWSAHDISGRDGEKFDLVDLLDLDGDGDLDIVTTEETGLGVIWYENPVRSPGRG